VFHDSPVARARVHCNVDAKSQTSGVSDEDVVVDTLVPNVIGTPRILPHGAIDCGRSREISRISAGAVLAYPDGVAGRWRRHTARAG
jgi:hypothetical protein